MAPRARLDLANIWLTALEFIRCSEAITLGLASVRVEISKET
jgi:hypothetical protein